MQKRDIQPFISVTSKNIIYKLSFITGYSVKKICGELCTHSLRSKHLGEELQPYFKREIKIRDVVYQPSEKPLKQYRPSEDLERVTVKIGVPAYELVYSLAHALGWSVAKVVAYCIERSMNDFDFLDFYITKILSSKMDEKRKEMFLSMVGEANQQSDEDLTIASLLIGIVDEMKQAEESVTDAVSRVVESW